MNSAVDQCIERLEAAFDITVCLLAYPDMSVSEGGLMFIGDYLGLLRAQTENPSVNSANKAPLKMPAVLTNGQGVRSTQSPILCKNKIALKLTPERLYKLERLLRVLVDKMKYPVDASAEEMVRSYLFDYMNNKYFCAYKVKTNYVITSWFIVM